MGFLSGQTSPRSHFYASLATALDAGLGVEETLAMVSEGPFATPARRLRGAVAQGTSLAGAMARQADAFSAFEVLALEAAEAGGRMVDVLRRLAAHFQDRGRTRDRLVQALIYPVILLHAAVLLPPAFVLVRDGALAYLGTVVPPLVAVYALVFAGVWLTRVVTADESRRRGVARRVLRLPLVGPIVHGLALADYAYFAGTLITSGVPLVKALRTSAEASRNAVVQDAGHRVVGAVERGDAFWQALASEPEAFPYLFVEAVKVGEIAGRLDDALERAEKSWRQEAAAALQKLKVVLPVLALAAAGAVVAWVVVRFLKAIFAGVGL